jgi:hypothetical protein
MIIILQYTVFVFISNSLLTFFFHFQCIIFFFVNSITVTKTQNVFALVERHKIKFMRTTQQRTVVFISTSCISIDLKENRIRNFDFFYCEYKINRIELLMVGSPNVILISIFFFLLFIYFRFWPNILNCKCKKCVA